MEAVMPLNSIPPTKTPPTVGRIVLVKYLDTRPGREGRRDSLPAVVIRPFVSSGAHPLVNVVVFGDGPANAPITESTILYSLTLFDPLPDGALPPEVVTPPDGPFRGMRVWAEWMPYQKQAHDARGNTPGPTA